MNFEAYINNDFPALTLTDNLGEVKTIFREIPFSHFPIVDHGQLKGMISQVDIMYLLDEKKKIEAFSRYFQNYQIQSHTNCLDLLSVFAKNDTDIIPVVDKYQNYLGYFELDEILHLFYKTPFLTAKGITLITQKNSNQFSMSEIAQIIESNNVDVLGMYVSDIHGDKTQITIRLETENINEVIQSLRRYDYEVLNIVEADLLIEQLKERSEYLQKFFDI